MAECAATTRLRDRRKRIILLSFTGRTFDSRSTRAAESRRRPGFKVSSARQGFPAFSCGRRDGGFRRRYVVIQLCPAARRRAFAQLIPARDSRRGTSISVEKRARRCSSQCKRRQMELFEKEMTQQLLAAKFSHRLRAICATPVQKGARSTRLARFLYCVCRMHR